MKNRYTKILILLVLLSVLIGCSSKTNSIEKIKIQCWDGSIVDNKTQCPPNELVVENESVVEEQQIENTSKGQVDTNLIEIEENKSETPPVEKSELEKRLEFFTYNQDFTYIYKNIRRAIQVRGDYRIWDWNILTGIGRLYDMKAKKIYLYYANFPEDWWAEHKELPKPDRPLTSPQKDLPAYFEIQLTGNEAQDRASMPKDKYKRPIFDEDLIFDNIYATGPINYMKKYKDQTIVKREELPGPDEELRLSFDSLDNKDKILVFYFNKFTTSPYKIQEKTKDGIITNTVEYAPIKVTNATAEYQSQFIDENKTTAEDWLPKDHIIIDKYDYQKWIERLEEMERR